MGARRRVFFGMENSRQCPLSHGVGLTTPPSRCLGKASDSEPPSRAVEPALGQEMPRAMGHFQARKWQKAHRALCKKTFTRPLHRGGYHEVNSFRLAFGKPPSRRRKGNAASVRKRRAQCAASKLTNGKKPTSSRQGVLVCGALRLPHDLMRLPLLFPQNSLRDFCGSPEIIPQSFCCAKSLREP